MKVRIVLPDNLYKWYKSWTDRQKIKYHQIGLEEYPCFASYSVIPESDIKKEKNKNCKKINLNECGWTHQKIKSNRCLFEHWEKKVRLFERSL